MGFRVVNGQVYPIGNFPQAIENTTKGNQVQKNNEFKVSFDDLLEQKLNKNKGFVLSNHASERLSQRNINFSKHDMEKINEGINKAEQKGSKESVILYKDIALVTSIKNRTVITAVGKEESNVFTNIDSVVLL